MEHDKHLHRRDDADDLRRNEDEDQLRPNTMNEAIRAANGDPDMDISPLNDQGAVGRSRDDRDLYGTDSTQGMSYTPNDASAVRSGGTTDMDDQTLGGAGVANERRGAGTNINTKRDVTGSDYDGQNATS